jgi:antitoxin component of RelBE/YafQ-DinJ toxin-antitoxin module
MAGKKQEITKDSYLRIRLETKDKKKYLTFCEKIGIKHSEHIREFVLKTIKND